MPNGGSSHQPSSPEHSSDSEGHWAPKRRYRFLGRHVIRRWRRMIRRKKAFRYLTSMRVTPFPMPGTVRQIIATFM